MQIYDNDFQMVLSKRRKQSLNAVEAKKTKSDKTLEPRENVIADLLILGEIFKDIFFCPGCKRAKCLTIGITTTDFLNNYLKISCSKCTFSNGRWTLHDNYNTLFHAATTSAGITNTQTQRLLAMGALCVKTTSGQERVPDFLKDGSTSSKQQRLVDDIIINLAAESMLNFRKSLVSESRKKTPKRTNWHSTAAITIPVSFIMNILFLRKMKFEFLRNIILFYFCAK